MSRRVTLFIAILLLLLIGTVVFIYSQLEFIETEETIDIGLSGEAAINPLLAAERFLNQMGIAAKTIEDSSRITEEIGEQDALLISSDRQTLGPTRSQQLLDWVKAGGRLVITIPHDAVIDLEFEIEDAEDVDDPDWEFTDKPQLRDHILSQLGISVSTEEVSRCESETTQITVGDEDEFLEVNLNPDFVLHGENEDDTVIDSQSGAALIRRHIGAGMVTVVSDLELITFKHIGDYDHAEFLWYLVNGQGNVWLVPQNELPSLWKWLWQNAPEMMTALFLLLLFWLWSRAPRFGPLVAEPPPVRRRILEHILASGRFLWQHEQQEQLIKAVRDELMDTAARRHPAWVGMSLDERAEHIAGVTGLSEDAARILLDGEEIRHRNDFTRTIRQLENIRKKL